MRAQGYLDTRQMAGAFQLLRSNDLVWSQRVREYLLGKQPMSDLWRGTATRRACLTACTRATCGACSSTTTFSRAATRRGRRVALADIKLPLAVGTVRDHVAPVALGVQGGAVHRSDITFVLASGGHNVGIVSQPGRDGRTYQIGTRRHDEPYVDADRWAEQAPRHAGSWWPQWQRWLAERSGPPAPAPDVGNAQAGPRRRPGATSCS